MAEAKNVRYGNVSSTLTVAPLREKGLYTSRCSATAIPLPNALNQRSKDSVGENAKDIGDQTRVVGQTVTESMEERQHLVLGHFHSQEGECSRQQT